MSARIPRLILGLAALLFALGLVCIAVEISVNPVSPHPPVGIFGAVLFGLAYLVALVSLYIAKSPVPLRSGGVLYFQSHPLRVRFWYVVLALLGVVFLFVFVSLLFKQHVA